MSENWIKTLSVNQIPDEEAVDFDVGNNKKIAIFNVNNNFFATDNLCTHEDASLCDGYIDGDTVECPLHQGVFKVSTGEVLEPPVTKNLKTYQTKIVDGNIFVDLNS